MPHNRGSLGGDGRSLVSNASHVEIVSRDGSSEYASTIKKGAPHARQVSDRWHLVKNLAACVSVQLARSLAQIRRAQQAAANAAEEEQPSRQQHSHPRTQAEQRTQQARQAERLARYEQITTLRKQGVKHTDIAAQVRMAERTVRGWLSRGNIPFHPLDLFSMKKQTKKQRFNPLLLSGLSSC
ncbi:MAG TPA: hypothetical protein DEV72_20500 [Ktedonobacter sp.]|nr:hypothetical protein [Ktedonobacter sp.]